MRIPFRAACTLPAPASRLRCSIAAIVTQTCWLAAIALIEGYAFAWVGHFFFEHNKPATFKYPGFSLMGDWRLWWDILTGRQKF